jgi:hypothetical protein
MKLQYSNGQSDSDVESPTEAFQEIRQSYPRAVCYDAGAWKRQVEDDLEAYDVRSGRIALYWETEAESREDNGSAAIAELVED